MNMASFVAFSELFFITHFILAAKQRPNEKASHPGAGNLFFLC